MIPAAVFALSFSTLLFELCLSRWFAIAHWGHLQTLVIAIALFGSAVSGAVTARLPTPGVSARAGGAPGVRIVFAAICLACAPVLPGSFLLARLIPLDYLRFPVDRMQLVWLFSACLCLALPFFLAGLAACLAYVLEPERSGRTAFAAMAGSGAGAAAAAVLIPGVGEGTAVVIAALVPLGPAMAAAVFRGPGSRRVAGPVIGAAGALAAAGILWAAAGPPLDTTPSPYKRLSQLLMLPGTRIVSRSDSIWGSARVVESPLIRFAPGLSLAFTGRLPPQSAVVVDGDGMTAISDLSVPGAEEFARNTHAFLPYAGAPKARRSCLVIQRGGGLAVVAAAASGAGRIDLVTDSPEAARRAELAYGAWNVSAITDNPRSFAAASGEKYDVIHVEDWGPSIPGMSSLSIDVLLTTDAFRAYWRRLSADGALAVSRRLVIPPSDSLRIFAGLLEALRREGVASPQDRIAVVRSWDSCTFMACRGPLGTAAREGIKAWCEGMGFDLDWLPGIAREETNRFNRLEDSWFYDSYAALVQDSGYARGYYLDIAPQSDDRPFPSRFIRWTRFTGFLRATGGRTYTILMSGEIVAGVVFLEALLFAAVVLAAPLLARAGTPAAVPRRIRRRPEGRDDRGAARAGTPAAVPRRIRRRPERLKPPMASILLFIFIGFGYIFAEVAFLDALTVAFASPLAAFAVVLGGMLVFSGIGGLAAGRLPRAALLPVLITAGALSALAAFCMVPAVRALLPLPPAARVCCSLLLLAAPSAVLGVPFALAVRGVPVPQWRAYAWAANGSASVVAAGAAALLAMAWGIGVLALAAAAAYLCAAAGAGRGLPSAEALRIIQS
jgi:hypothetical protein